MAGKKQKEIKPREESTDTSRTEEQPFGYCLVDLVKTKWPFLVVAAVTALAAAIYGSPITKTESHEWRMWLAGLGVALLVFRLSQKGRALSLVKGTVTQLWETRVYYAILVVAIVFGIFNYFNFDKKQAEGIGDGTDMAYYYLNTKYLHELGYFRFYAAALTADKELNNRWASKLKRYRDLRDYETKSTRVAFEHGREIKEKYFTPERWEQFKHDVDYFLAYPDMARLYDYFFVDHGYNPPPTWAVPGYILAELTPVENVKWIAMVDVVLLLVALVAICWAFGGETTLYVMLFFVVTFSGRWPLISHCLLRFDWSSALIASICLLKKERWALAGAALGYAAMNRIFPAIFFFPWLMLVIKNWVETKSLNRDHLKFGAAAAAVAVVLIVSAIGLFGPEKLAESAHNLDMHNRSYSSHRVGLADLFVYDGETTRKEINEKGGLRAKEELVQGTRTMRNVLGFLTLVFIGVYIMKDRRQLYELIHFSAIPLFCVTTPQINYYNLRMIFIMWHVFNLAKGRFHQLGVIGLFLIEVITQHSHVIGNERFATTAYTSYGLFFYYLYLIGWMVVQIQRVAKEKTN